MKYLFSFSLDVYAINFNNKMNVNMNLYWPIWTNTEQKRITEVTVGPN
jgi:hypothetical protein